MTYFHKTGEMEKGLAGEDYSSAAGACVTGLNETYSLSLVPARTTI